MLSLLIQSSMPRRESLKDFELWRKETVPYGVFLTQERAVLVTTFKARTMQEAQTFAARHGGYANLLIRD